MSRRSKVVVGKSLYQMAIVTIASSVVWVVISVYHAIVAPAKIEVSPEMLKPLSPVIKQEVLESLAKRRQMSEADWSRLERVVRVSEIVEPKITIPEEATGSSVAEP